MGGSESKPTDVNKIEYLDDTNKKNQHVEDNKSYINDSRYVQLPFYEKKKWGLVYNNLSFLYNEIKTSQSFEVSLIEKVIMSYNAEYINDWNFSVLFEYLEQINSNNLREFVLNLINLTLDLPSLMSGQPIPILMRGVSKHLTLSQMQCASLLANAFFCTFPLSDNRNLNSINFHR